MDAQIGVAVRYCILGPLEVRSPDGRVDLGGPKPRALLAALLVARGTVVGRDRLVQAVWGERPPARAAAALHSYVSRLRAVLGTTTVARRDGGYVLTLAPPDDVDADVFEALLARAHAAARTDDHPRALHLLEDALGLWRGPVLDGLDRDDARTGAARLDELRVGAEEARADALHGLGRHDEAIAAMASLVHRLPLREQAVRRLMAALYSAGRQADALVAFDHLRHRLVDELGVDPSPAVRALHARILGQDPLLAPADTAGNLPRRTPRLVGRADELAGLVLAVRGAAVVTLTGAGGVGKSRLAVAAAALLADRHPDGAWLCELAPLHAGGPVGHAIARALGVQQRTGLSIEDTVVEYLRHRDVLLVLDNCEHVLDATAALVDVLVRQCPGVTVLATSREALGVPAEQRRPLSPLSPADGTALFLLRTRAERPDHHLDTADLAAVTEICRRLDGLPLAIELAAARMRAMSAQEIRERLEDGQLLRGGPRTALPHHQSLGAAIDWSYRQLTGPEQQLFTRLSTFSGGCELRSAHAVCAGPGATTGDTLELLTTLVDKSMLTASVGPGPTRYHLLETLRVHGRTLLGGTAAAAAHRHAVHFTELAEAAAAGLQGEHERSWVERILPEHDNLRAAFETAAALPEADLALRLASALPEPAHLRVGYESAGWAERALDLAGPGHPLHAATVGAAARGAWNHGDFQRATDLAHRAHGQVPARGTGRIAYPADVLADVALYEGDAAAALVHYAAEAERARREGDRIRLVWTLYYVAVCQAVLRVPERGEQAARQCLAEAAATGNTTARSMARYALGLVLKKSDPDRAVVLFDEAASLAGSVHNFWWSGIALMEATSVRAVHGDPVRAAADVVGVLDHWERVGDRTQQWLNLRYVVRLLLRLGAEEHALVLHHALLAAGRPSPLAAAVTDRLELHHPGAAARGSGLSSSGAVDLARSSLQRHLQPPASGLQGAAARVGGTAAVPDGSPHGQP